jgi:hypothetical protein
MVVRGTVKIAAISATVLGQGPAWFRTAGVERILLPPPRAAGTGHG